jgi:membrane-associated protease RseP (regulator of RpoE activity)
MNDLLMSIVGNSFLGAVLAFALVLIPSVIIHELGHFIAGKLVGITILDFGVWAFHHE